MSHSARVGPVSRPFSRSVSSFSTYFCLRLSFAQDSYLLHRSDVKLPIIRNILEFP